MSCSSYEFRCTRVHDRSDAITVLRTPNASAVKTDEVRQYKSKHHVVVTAAIVVDCRIMFWLAIAGFLP